MSESPHLRMIVPKAPWTDGLTDGSVRVPGLSWECVADPGRAPERFAASAKDAVDVGENGVRWLVRERLSGGPAHALPVWFGREHFQRNIIVREDSQLTSPRELAGKRVGSRQPIVSGTCAGVLLVLEHGCGVPPGEIQWFVRESDGLPVNRLQLDLRPGPPSIQAGFQQLLDGELDAMLVGGGPRYWSLFGPDPTDEELAGWAGLRHLVQDPGAIAEVYRRTGLYPITDLAIVRPGLEDRYPSVSRRVMSALAEANALAPEYRPASEQRLAEHEQELLGEDPHEYGLGPKTRRNLELLVDQFFRLGAIDRPLELDELFVPSVL